jgi:hypothetical protein
MILRLRASNVEDVVVGIADITTEHAFLWVIHGVSLNSREPQCPLEMLATYFTILSVDQFV